METTLISTIYSIDTVIFCITQLKPDKVILLREDNTGPDENKVKQILKDISIELSEIISHDISLNDEVQVARNITELIDNEKESGRKLVVNVSGGVKSAPISILFGCYARQKEIERIIFVLEEYKELIDLPILNFGISKTKKKLLEALMEGEKSIKNLSINLGISRGMTYNHIRELREMGFIEPEKLDISFAGKLAFI